MDSENSILDKIITSKKTSDIERFNPSEVVSALLKNLTSREEDVLRRRHGLLGRERETLENIGASYRVTRERIRQIENTAIKKIKKLKNFREIVAPLENTVYSVLEQHGGIMAEEVLLEVLLQSAGDNKTNRLNILFVIAEFLDYKFKYIRGTKEYRKSWQIIHAPIGLLKETMNVLLKIISLVGKPMSIEDVLKEFKKNPFYERNKSQLSDDIIISYLEINPRVSKNPFDEYGLTEWGTIVPKRMNDKIFLILKREGKPMHFTDIAEKINAAKFDSRKAYPPTVHNELILNDHYVLVGRGIYALKEWGYKPGVVSNVLIETLKNSSEPLTREQLVESVLKQRIVKKNTIHLALTDKTKFKKHPDGTYSLADVAN